MAQAKKCPLCSGYSRTTSTLPLHQPGRLFGELHPQQSIPYYTTLLSEKDQVPPPAAILRRSPAGDPTDRALGLIPGFTPARVHRPAASTRLVPTCPHRGSAGATGEIERSSSQPTATTWRSCVRTGTDQDRRIGRLLIRSVQRVRTAGSAPGGAKAFTTAVGDGINSAGRATCLCTPAGGSGRPALSAPGNSTSLPWSGPDLPAAPSLLLPTTPAPVPHEPHLDP
jgi:hypothetical protein